MIQSSNLPKQQINAFKNTFTAGILYYLQAEKSYSFQHNPNQVQNETNSRAKGLAIDKYMLITE